MQIRDMLGQYSQNVKNGTEELMSAQGTQKLVSSMQELEPGSTFEGTVNSVKNGKVILALGNGQTITARLDGKVSIQPGESMTGRRSHSVPMSRRAISIIRFY